MAAKLQYDPAAAITHLREADPVLGGAIDRIGPFGLELLPVRNLLEALLRSIVYQQLHGKAAATIHSRVLAVLRGHGGIHPPAIARATDEALRAAGLSRAKLAAIRDLAAKCEAGVVPTIRAAHHLDDDELVARLTEVRGIGPWTVHMLLIFHLGRPDVSRRAIMPSGSLSGASTANAANPRPSRLSATRAYGSLTARSRRGRASSRSGGASPTRRWGLPGRR